MALEEEEKLLWADPEYVKTLRGACDGTDRYAQDLWQKHFGEYVPVNYSVIDAWRSYYDAMEELDRRYLHAPARRGSRSVIPQPMPRWHQGYYKEGLRIKDLLHRELGKHQRSPTSAGYSEQDTALHEHEKALKRCECRECKQYR